jgi:hypothetical protein
VHLYQRTQTRKFRRIIARACVPLYPVVTEGTCRRGGQSPPPPTFVTTNSILINLNQSQPISIQRLNIEEVGRGLTDRYAGDDSPVVAGCTVARAAARGAEPLLALRSPCAAGRAIGAGLCEARAHVR